MRTSLEGPVILYGGDNPQQLSNTDQGPNVDYQSNAILDSRYVSQVTAAGEGAQGGILAWHNPVEIEALSCIPQAPSAVLIAAAQAPTVGGFFTLASANAVGLAVGIPLIPFGQPIIPGSANLVSVLALDFGFAIGTTTTAAATANTLTLTGPTPGGYTATATYASRFFYPGQRILVPGAGLGGAVLSTIVNATDRYAAPGFALAATGTVTMANPALTVATNVGIGTPDQEYGVAVKPVVKAGAIRVYDPAQLTSRNTTVTASGASTGSVTVRGYDIYEQPMSEQITIVGTGTGSGKKAFGYISSVQFNLGGTLAGTLSIGTGSAIGLPIRVDLFEYTSLFVNNVQIVGAAGSLPAGFVTADQTLPATSTTGDVRGTYLPGTINGTARLVYWHQQPIASAKVSTNIDFRGYVGVVQA